MKTSEPKAVTKAVGEALAPAPACSCGWTVSIAAPYLVGRTLPIMADGGRDSVYWHSAGECLRCRRGGGWQQIAAARSTP